MCVHYCQKAHLHIAVNHDFVQLRIGVISNINKYIVDVLEHIQLMKDYCLMYFWLISLILLTYMNQFFHSLFKPWLKTAYVYRLCFQTNSCHPAPGVTGARSRGSPLKIAHWPIQK